MVIYDTILYLIANAFRVVLCIYLYYLFFKQPRFKTIWLWVFGGVYFSINSSLFLLYNNPAVNTINTVLFLFILCFFFRCSKVQHIFFPIISLALSIVVETVAAFFPMMAYAAVQEFQVGISMVINDFLLCLIVLLLKHYNYKEQRLPFFYWCILFSIPILSIVIEQLMVYQLILAPLQMVVLFTILILANILIFVFYDRLTKYYLTQNELRLAQEQIRMYKGKADIQRQAEERIDGILHDMNNHIAVLYQQLESGNLDAAKNYLQSLGSNITKKHKASYCGNPYIDSVLSQKCYEMDQLGIKYHLDLMVPMESIVEDTDMCTILFNLLDNAIEAQQFCQEHYIELEMLYRKNIYYIHVVNSCDTNLNLDSETHLPTTKSDPLSHGFGMQNVNAAVKRYHGTSCFTAKDGVFDASVFLYIDIKEALQKFYPDQT